MPLDQNPSMTLQLLYELQVYPDQFLAASPRPDLELPLQPHIHHLTGVARILLAPILLVFTNVKMLCFLLSTLRNPSNFLTFPDW